MLAKPQKSRALPSSTVIAHMVKDADIRMILRRTRTLDVPVLVPVLIHPVVKTDESILARVQNPERSLLHDKFMLTILLLSQPVLTCHSTVFIRADDIIFILCLPNNLQLLGIQFLLPIHFNRIHGHHS